MATSPYQCKEELLRFDFINQEPIRLDVAFAITTIVPGQSVIAVLCGKRLLSNEEFEYLLE